MRRNGATILSVPYLKRPANFEDQSGGWSPVGSGPPPAASELRDRVSLLQQLGGATGRTLHKLPASVGGKA